MAARGNGHMELLRAALGVRGSQRADCSITTMICSLRSTSTFPLYHHCSLSFASRVDTEQNLLKYWSIKLLMVD